MATSSRWSKVKKGMSFEEVKKIFGKDMWQGRGFPRDTWLVSNESDKSSDHGYLITFDKDKRVKSKGSISTAG
jgi:outer membrane protein assembly factor BamE (lipoprotein component of BamABCDE complex)